MSRSVASPVTSLDPSSSARAALETRTWLTSERFAVAVLLISLVLQRFALPAGGALKISIATPLVLILAVWGIGNGTLTLHRRRAGLFFGLFSLALITVVSQISVPLAIAPRSSTNSLLYWLLITSFAVLRFREPMDENRFFRLVSLCLAGIAIAGLLQFILQFAGVSVFAFAGIIPVDFLIEEQYAVRLPIEGTGLFRSNGFFLVEPSVFSQFMAIGLIVEWLYSRNLVRLGLCVGGLLVSLSGTGWLILGAFVLVVAFTSGLRGPLIALVLMGVGAIIVTAGSLIVPDVANAFLGRLFEFSLPGTSGHERFVTPFLALQATLEVAPWTFFTGLGPGTSETLTLPFFYRLNTPIKVLMEYGIGSLLFYLALLISGNRPIRQWRLLAPLLTLLLLTGGYHQFSPVLFPVLLLGTVATLANHEEVTALRGHNRVQVTSG